MERVLRLRHPTNATHRLAIVSLQQGEKEGAFVVAIARGEKRTKLTDSRLYGPFSLDEAEKAWASVVKGLGDDGYLPSGVAELLETIATSKKPRLRARAAERLGWRKEVRAVDALLTRAATPKDDVATLVVALGRIGPPEPERGRALPLLRAEAARKLLSRRRAGAEALRLLGDADGLKGVRERALERLPDAVKSALLASNEDKEDGADVVAAAVVKGGDAERGAACDALYDVGSVLAVAAARSAMLALDVSAPNHWRYCKSMMKRAALRTDGQTFGALLHAVEIRGRSTKGTTASLKSGLDGETRKMRVFSPRTVEYVRRAGWRLLRQIARHRPADYPLFAAWCVVAYKNEDDVAPHKRLPAHGKSYLLSRVLFGGGHRFVVDSRRVRFLFKGTKPLFPLKDQREEMFPALWDLPSSAAAYHVLLGRGRHHAVVKMAVDAVARRPALLEGASTEDLARMLASPDERLGDLAFTALRVRFNAEKPDAAAILGLGVVDNDRARTLAGLWLTSSAHVWSRDAAVAAQFLSGPPAVREAAARLLLLALPSSTPALKAALADALLVAIAGKEPVEGAFSSWAELSSSLAPELVARCSIERALSLMDLHDAGAAVAAVVVGAISDPLAVLGATALSKLAASEQASRRAVAIAALTTSKAAFRDQLALTLTLGEGEWDDVRAAVVDVLAGLDAARLDLPRWMALLDATHPSIQNVAKQLLSARLAAEPDAVDVHELLARLAQHPHKNIRSFVVDLATARLKPGYVRLAKLESLTRAALFDLRPDRPLRRKVIAFLLRRGQQDEAQAELVVGLLGDVVRSRTHEARDDAASAIALLRLQWPELQLPAHVVVEVGA